MARKPNTGRREMLTPQQIAEFRARLRAMTDAEILLHYKAAHNACVYRHWPPAPIVIQEFVQVWRELRSRDGFRSY
jgi:hypothetical protein